MNYKNLVVVVSSFAILIASPALAISPLPTSPDYVPPLKRPATISPLIDVNKYAIDFSSYDGYKIVSPHTPTTPDERYNPVFYPEYVHEMVDLRTDLTDVQNNVSRLSQQQFNSSPTTASSVSDPRCDSLDARVRQLEQQVAALTQNGTGGGLDDLSDDPSIQTISRRLTNVEGVTASNDTFIKRIMKFLKLK